MRRRQDGTRRTTSNPQQRKGRDNAEGTEISLCGLCRQVNGVAKGDCLFIPVVDEGISKTMGAGIDIFEEGCSYEWTVIYDELMFVLEGNFRLVVGDERFECEPGDILWIPNGTPAKYEADGHTVCFYVLYPVDWENPKVGPQDQA